MQPSLASMERAIFSLITGQGHPASSAGELVVSDGRAQADERLQIYASMYRARLVEALAAEFPRLARRLGAAPFAALVADYVHEHPSRHPSLRFLGQHLADWISRQRAWGAEHSLLAHLARLEWSRSDVFDGPDEPLLKMDALRVWPAEAFATLPLRLVGASRLIVVDVRALDLWSSLGACRGNPDRAWRSAAGPDARREEGEYSTYSTDEQRSRRPGSARHATWSGYRDRLLGPDIAGPTHQPPRQQRSGRRRGKQVGRRVGKRAGRAVVWRQGITVFHRFLDAAEARALDQVAVGTTLGHVCDGLAEALSAQEATAQAFAWLATWATDELLVAP